MRTRIFHELETRGTN
jgi:hypothetical protein